MTLQRDLKAELDELRPLVEMMEHKGWKSVEARFRADVDILSALSWRVGSAPSKKMVESLTMMGIPEPKTKEEMFDCFHQFRAVVNYLDSKLGYLAQCKKRFEILKASIAQKEIKDDR